jgi:hypothetical protein
MVNMIQKVADPEKKYFFRYSFAYYSTEKIYLYCEFWRPVKYTLYGVWIVPEHEPDDSPAKRLIYPGSKRCYAKPTREEALQDFIIRKEHEMGHLTRRLFNIEAVLKLTPQAKEDIDKYNEIVEHRAQEIMEDILIKGESLEPYDSQFRSAHHHKIYVQNNNQSRNKLSWPP